MNFELWYCYFSGCKTNSLPLSLMGGRELNELSTAHPKFLVHIAKHTTWLATGAHKSELDTDFKFVIYFVGNLFFLLT